MFSFCLTHIHASMCAHALTIHACTDTLTHTHTCTHHYTYTHLHTNTFPPTHIHTYKRMHTHICAHTHTHTHTSKDRLANRWVDIQTDRQAD